MIAFLSRNWFPLALVALLVFALPGVILSLLSFFEVGNDIRAPTFDVSDIEIGTFQPAISIIFACFITYRTIATFRLPVNQLILTIADLPVKRMAL